ncbi:MAG: hypothetical protein HGB31_08345 [Erysipelotrichaceae bacterium]|nr:hypothetical protein [Erysipelotrichaceae bacterium]
MNYKMIVYTIESNNGLEYIAEYPKLKGVSGVGKDENEAIHYLITNAKINITALRKAGLPVPESDMQTTEEGTLLITTNDNLELNQKTKEAIKEVEDLISKNDPSDQMTTEELFKDLEL